MYTLKLYTVLLCIYTLQEKENDYTTTLEGTAKPNQLYH